MSNKILNIFKIVKQKQLYLISIILFSFIFDRVTKHLLLSFFIKSNAVSNIFCIKVFSFFNIIFVLNDGVSFGMLSGMNAKYYLIIISLTILIILFTFLIKDNFVLNKIAYCLIIGGAIGNLYDRIFIGAVVDFLDFYIKFNLVEYHWPAFNVADSSIFLGVCCLFIFQFNQSFKSNKKY